MTGEQKLHHCFSNAFGTAAIEDPSRLAFGSTAWDSIAHIALVTELETAFALELTPEDITDLTSYSNAREVLSRHGIALDR